MIYGVMKMEDRRRTCPDSGAFCFTRWYDGASGMTMNSAARYINEQSRFTTTQKRRGRERPWQEDGQHDRKSRILCYLL